MKFYMTYNRQSPVSKIVPWINEKEVPLMTNVSSRWSERTERFNEMPQYDSDLAIDSGGYNSQSDYVDRSGELKVSKYDILDELDTGSPFFPWTVSEYHTYLESESENFEKAFVMDYACEERFDTLWTVEDRVDATIENTIRHFEMDPSYDLIPVLQGRTIDDYVRCYQELDDRGIPVDEVGLGTVCRLSSSEQIVDLEKEIRDRTGVETIHGFGAKIDAFKMGSTFDSADSHAWVYPASKGFIRKLSWNEDDELEMFTERWDDYADRKFFSFKVYYAYVTWIMNGESAIDVDELLAEQQKLDA